jgi:RNA polymerase sigma-70 factor (ECF subfamily)
MSEPETRHSLIVRLQGPRNEAAWGEFVGQYERFVRRLVQRRGVPERHVPDVTQQVLAAIAQSVAKWQDDGQPASFRRWTSRIARNVVIKFMIREARQFDGQGGTDLVEQLQSIPDPVDDQLAQRYEHELIVWAAEQIRSEFRDTSWQAFWATLVEGRPVAEVAAELRISVGSIYMSRSRIIKRIRGLIDELM